MLGYRCAGIVGLKLNGSTIDFVFQAPRFSSILDVDILAAAGQMPADSERNPVAAHCVGSS